MTKKITYGFVTQTFDSKGNLLKQDFQAGDQVEYEDAWGDAKEPKIDLYYPYDMVQPS
jgi:hypothetical protein